ncbi:MAG: Lrp/AsnC family transcriptional regulator [Candidatus Micrarchaeota archaeon]|nr:Lrp/AsnC family transcriptional regulator [Candidatus Micrarchaeota archaeon]
MVEYEFASEFNERWSPLAKRMLRLLSEDSRMSITELASKLGVSRKTVGDKLKQAERELAVKYTLELDEAAIGLVEPHIILVKFTDKPDYDVIKKMLGSSYIPQVAVSIDGTYNMFIYANAVDAGEYVYWDKTTQIMLSKYRALWQPSDIAFRHLGFFPIRNALLEKLKIPETYKRILLLLNENARMSINEMSKRLGMRPNTLAYKLKKLLKMGYIKRFTITMRTPQNISMMTLFGKYIIGEGFEDDSMKMRKEVTFLDDKVPLISRCLFSAQLIGSYDFFFVGVYDSAAVGMERLVRYYKQRFRRHSVKVMHGTIGLPIIGDFPTRNLDVKAEFNMIRWLPGNIPKVEKPSLQ